MTQEKYQPSPEELQKAAEEMMTDEQKMQSEARAEGYAIGKEAEAHYERTIREEQRIEEYLSKMLVEGIGGGKINLDRVILTLEEQESLCEKLDNLKPGWNSRWKKEIKETRHILMDFLVRDKRYDDAVKIAEMTGDEVLIEYAKEERENGVK